MWYRVDSLTGPALLCFVFVSGRRLRVIPSLLLPYSANTFILSFQKRSLYIWTNAVFNVTPLAKILVMLNQLCTRQRSVETRVLSPTVPEADGNNVARHIYRLSFRPVLIDSIDYLFSIQTLRVWLASCNPVITSFEAICSLHAINTFVSTNMLR